MWRAVKQNWNDQIKKLEEALAETPGSTVLRRQLGEALAESGDYQRAEQELKRALQYKAHDEKSLLSLAELYIKLGKKSAALVLLEPHIDQREPNLKLKQLYQELDQDGAIEMDEADELQREKVAVTQPEDNPEDMINDQEAATIDFSQVGGMARVKEEITMKIILPMTNQDLYAAYGKKAGGGILLYGPPGCGKTHLARATAGQIKARFISVGLNDILDMYLGQSEQKLHALFQTARQNKPCVLFFDEVDALGANRGDVRKQAGRTVVNQFLMELDGLNDQNEGVLVLAATNAPWYLDQAFRRPGRFDRIIFVEPPDQAARVDILKMMLADKPTDRVDYEKIAKSLKHFSGADIKALVDRAVETKLRQAMKHGQPLPLITNEIIAESKKIKASTKEWFITAKNYAIYANESGLYDDILTYLEIK